MGDSIRVLFVRSNIDTAKSIAASLEDATDTFDIEVESNAEAGLELLRTGTFDCVVSGYELPGRDGIGFLETVRERYQGLPFVLYTAQGNEAVAAAAISADVTEYVTEKASTDQDTVLATTIEKAVGDSTTSIDAESSNQRLEQILKTVPGCVVQLDGDGQFIYANRRAKEVLGLEQSAVTGRTYNDPEWVIRDPQGDPIPDDELPFRQVWDSGDPLTDYRHSIQWPDGSEKTLSVSGAPLLDDQGIVDSVVFSLADVTEQQRREQELKRYQQIVDHLDDIATTIDPDGTITYVSPAVERILGYEPQELIGQNGFGYQPPETSKTVAAAVEEVLSDPTEPYTVQTKFRRADGSWCWIESTLRNRTEDDMIGGILVSSREITERMEQKHQIQQRRQQLSRLHEATRELLQSDSPQQVAAAASQTAVDILDFSLNGIHFYDEAVDGLAPIAVSEGSRELFDEVPVIDEGIAWETFQSGEEHIYNDVGEASDLYNAESPIQSEATLPLVGHGVFIISATQKNAFTKTDIEFARILAANTEAALKRITKEQQLRTRETELEQQNERLEEFASIVSHDLRNPLNVAQGRADLLGDECDSEHLAPVEEALERMEELISDTLTLARQGKVVAETESIQLSNLVGECWNTVATDDATLETAEGVTFHGDRSRLQHVFENLFRNAIEHGGTGVTIRVGRIDDNGFYVEDTGPGIPKAARETVFEPGETSAADGTGFGLSIVKRTVEAHGWEVGVVAGSEGGARFEVTGIDMHDY